MLILRYIDPFHAFITPSFGLHSTFDLTCNHLGLFNFKRDDSLGSFLFLDYEVIIFTENIGKVIIFAENIRKVIEFLRSISQGHENTGKFHEVKKLTRCALRGHVLDL